ncbi:MAG: hypothetical protein IID44_25075 [Planctomycetes bacterium]|nr:hypothetical protein [Planctomycetota bacterium]
MIPTAYVSAELEEWNRRFEELWTQVFPFDGVVPVFDRLASIDAEKDAIRDFANQYGAFGIGDFGARNEARGLRTPDAPHWVLRSTRMKTRIWPQMFRDSKGSVVYGDPLSAWLEDLKAIKVCVRIFRALLTDDYSSLDSMFDFIEDESIIIARARGFNHPSYFHKVTDLQRRKLGMTAAGHLVCALVHQRIRTSCETSLQFHPIDKVFTFAYHPITFRDAIWFELSAAAHELGEFRECEACGHLFNTGDDGSSKSRLYCSAGCRMKALRDRQKRARQYRADGMHLSGIASKLGTKMKTVKGWVKDVPLP